MAGKIRRQINFRLNENEWEKVQEKIKKSNLPMSVSAYAKSQTLYGKIYTPGISERDVKIITTSLAQIGNNLNQIAKLFNSGKIPERIPIEKILNEIKSMEQELKNLFRIEKYKEEEKIKIQNKFMDLLCENLKNQGIDESIATTLLIIYPFKDDISDEGFCKILAEQNINLSLERVKEILTMIAENIARMKLITEGGKIK